MSDRRQRGARPHAAHGIVDREGAYAHRHAPADRHDLSDPRDRVAARRCATLIGPEMEVDHVYTPFDALLRTRRLVFDADGVGHHFDAGLLSFRDRRFYRLIRRIGAHRHVMATLALREEHVFEAGIHRFVIRQDRHFRKGARQFPNYACALGDNERRAGFENVDTGPNADLGGSNCFFDSREIERELDEDV
jgi:hypothetical protein